MKSYRATSPSSFSLWVVDEADMLIVGGTSLQVQPAASFVSYFSGKHLVVINKESIDVLLDADTDLMVMNSLGNVFSEIDKWF